MGIEVKLPELGDGIESGDILDVLVSEGDTISEEQSICEIETDKATVDVPSSHAGKVVKIHINAGDNVAIGATLITLEAVAAESPSPAVEPSAPPSEPVAPQPVASEPDTTEPLDPPPAPTQRTPAVAPKAPQAAPPTPATPSPTITDDHQTAPELAPAGPAIRRLAREVGVDLSKVAGTGASGRITRDDVLSIVRQASTISQASKTTAQPSTESPSTESPSTESPSTEPTTEDDWGPIHVERMTKIRKTIARKMHESWTSAPRVTNFDDADVTELEAIRQASKVDYSDRGIKLTSMPFVIKAVALALKSNPTINAMIDEANDQIIYKKYVNIGIAVDTDRGLLVPSLRNADHMGISDVARALGTIADNARNNNFKLEDLRGSTFTISNLGAIGGTYSTPIINVPEVAILLLGRSRKLPVVVNDQVVIRLMMPLSLSYDHRLVDGATAARFLNDVKSYLEQPSRLLIAP